MLLVYKSWCHWRRPLQSGSPGSKGDRTVLIQLLPLPRLPSFPKAVMTEEEAQVLNKLTSLGCPSHVLPDDKARGHNSVKTLS